MRRAGEERGERVSPGVRLRHPHGNGGLPRPRLPGDQHRAAGDVALLDHLENHARRLAGIGLPDHALRHHTRLERIVEAQPADVRVRADPLNPRDVLYLGTQHSGGWVREGGGWRADAVARVSRSISHGISKMGRRAPPGS